ncbi:hypothetical protein A3H80_04595 [Candidatus Roizmanbacteria bacterium RIFCSPLOWO2_02_FULL_37_19]|uniref:DUF6311 domain-containing protein n=1 Tax=Candidatus Roizmanbacteria bacterium RIFCSPHIGHO2_02_FULL_37_24 TaxID=1802037 RepID=A0A1F7GVC2_9BACT|nr:MAG: hypothetical protein A3C24_04360 [Candidatus Roizmanbacteria bacterium RIFCSPHIGHO2_02_FULL_37_24]OGK33813.1 MAG: hypothetical protein A3E10_02795 [Candidatus Roizmanbacteria bacterium RIFCSPHIGHO2_12_FULL_37_23]OGK43756.1 MAG: hypothetical protein A2956_00540 [Candidatus Roizmanbacteria bacterium RIFCSPLOWO2_01_FULL_37_57]OGK54870.1 MAG: hypothetical protein A3H80_04595 [Candidatus Roizmanbacteria bacterium RIFCSPLOWO2_02_FULL_37_19]
MIPLLGFLIVNLLYYRQIWLQVIFTDPLWVLTVQGESHIYELVAEKVRENILAGVDPFSSIMSVMYPLGWNFAPDDVAPINGFYFIFLRPFFSIHQSLMLILVLSVLISNISMYVLLRKLGHGKPVSFILGLLFGCTPFVSYRIGGHPTYVALYLFVLPALCFLLLIKETRYWRKVIYSVLLAVTLVIAPLTNLYFTIMIGLMIGVLGLFSIVFDRKKLFSLLYANLKYLIASFTIAFIILIPWLRSVFDWYNVNGYPEARPVTDSVLLSGDILNIIWPARNPYYSQFVKPLQNVLNFNPWFETLMYIGIIIFASSLLYVFIWKKLPSFLKILFSSAIVCYIFTLGPLLRVAGRLTSIPLPYQLLYQIPFMQMARAPARFIVIVFFLLSIISAYVLTHTFKRFNTSKRLFFFIFILLVFFIDNTVIPAQPDTIILPNRIYTFLAQYDKGDPLLEIPFVVRDGIRYFGHKNSVWTSRTHTQHKHFVFGVYAGRVPEDILEYYQVNPLLSSFGRLVDTETKNHQRIVEDINTSDAIKTLDFYNIRFATLLEHQTYSLYAQKLLKKLGFHQIQSENAYTLWERKSKNFRLYEYKFAADDPHIVLGSGWGERERGGRWAQKKIVRLFLQSPENAERLVFRARSLVDNQKVSVFIDSAHLQDVTLTKELEDVIIEIPNSLNNNVHVIQFNFPHLAVPSEVIPGNNDTRQLGAFFENIKIQ